MISNKIYSADIIRSLAIIFVVLFHFFEELMPFGWLGVDMFFLLSGFLITNLFFLRELKTFLFERLIRIILPLIFFFSFHFYDFNIFNKANFLDRYDFYAFYSFNIWIIKFFFF